MKNSVDTWKKTTKCNKDVRFENKVRKRKKPTAEVHDCCRLLAGPPPLLVLCKIFLVKTIVSKIPDLVELLTEDWGWGEAAIAFLLEENFVAEVAGII